MKPQQQKQLETPSIDDISPTKGHTPSNCIIGPGSLSREFLACLGIVSVKTDKCKPSSHISSIYYTILDY